MEIVLLATLEGKANYYSVSVLFMDDWGKMQQMNFFLFV